MSWTTAILAGLVVPGGVSLIAARAGADAALLVAFGAPLCRWLVLPAPASRGQRRLETVAVAAALVLTMLWAWLQALQIGGDPAAALEALGETQFGHAVLVRLGLLVAALVALAAGWLRWATLAGATALASQVEHGHAAAMAAGPSVLLASEALHVLAAGAWLGALPSLCLTVARDPAPAAAQAARRFAPLGTLCVVVLAITAADQGTVLVGGLPGWIGTAHGVVAVAKIVLFAVLLAFAARHRFRLVPGFAGGAGRTALLRSLAAEAGVGLTVVVAAAWLANLSPAMHTDPVWPFSVRFSTETVEAEPDFLFEVVRATGLLAALVLAALLALWRRWLIRWPLLLAVPISLWFAAPTFALLLVQASPTQYWRSPTGFTSASIVEGAALFPTYCVSCHGAQGHGDGPAAATLPVPPADLTAPHLWAHADGELFWWLSAGIEAPEGGLAMPGFEATLTEAQRWALIDYIRANNAGTAYAATGEWPLPVRAPALDFECLDPAVTTLTDLQGQVVRLVFGPARPVSGAVTIALGPERQPAGGLCVHLADGPGDAAALAYAVILGRPPAALAGTTVLIDEAGWLREALPQGGDLRRSLAAIAGHPLAGVAMTHAGMRM